MCTFITFEDKNYVEPGFLSLRATYINCFHTIIEWRVENIAFIEEFLWPKPIAKKKVISNLIHKIIVSIIFLC